MNLSKETDTLISVVTVSYNAVSTIEQTILSVINQTYPNVEYIIIDGGSTDGTVDIIKKYADKIAYWVSEPDKGIYDAMNKGGLKTTGDFIQFLNAGDWLENEHVIEKIFKDYLIFISRLCRYNCAYFYEVTDVPENVLTIINSALIEIQRDYKNENY